MQVISPEVILSYLPPRKPSAHKGNFGRVLVVAGSRSMCGAGALCSLAALRVGAGIVAWALPKQMQPSFAAAYPEIITVPLTETEEGFLAAQAHAELQQFCQQFQPTVLACGPGLGPSPLLPLLFKQGNCPAVWDADALNFLAAHPTAQPSKERLGIFTPHPGEMARLLRQEVALSFAARQMQVRAWAEISGGVTVLKGAETLIASAGEIWKNPTANAALAKGGSGDVLTGMIAGLWAQLAQEKLDEPSAKKAAVCGVYLHGLAGELAAQKYTTYGVLARELIQEIAQALKFVLEQRRTV